MSRFAIAPAAASLPWASALSRVMLAACAIYLVVLPTNHFGGLRNLAMLVASLAGLALVVLTRDVRTLLPSPGRVLFAAVLAWGGWLMLSAAWSVRPSYTLVQIGREVLQTGVVTVTFYVATRDDTALRVFVAAMLASFACLALAAIATSATQAGWQPTAWHYDVGVWSTFLVLVAPLLMMLVIPDPPAFGGGPRSLTLALGLTVLLLATLLLTRNRMGWIALAVAVVIASVGGLVQFARRTRGGRVRYVLFTVAALTVLALAFADAASERAERDFPGIDVLDALAQDPRLAVWSVAGDLIAARPLLGHGFGREVMRDAFLQRLANPLVEHPHDVLLGVWLQVGAIGLALFGVLLVALLATYRRFLAARGSRAALVGLLGLAAVCGFLVKNLTDDFLYGSNAKEFFALNAMLVGYGVRMLRAQRPGTASPPP